MFMPFLRLITIYAFVAVVVFAVFNRDQVLPLIGFGNAEQAEDLPPIPADIPESDDASPVAETSDGLPPIPPAPEKPEAKVAEDADAAAAKTEAPAGSSPKPAPTLQSPTPVVTDGETAALQGDKVAAVSAESAGTDLDDLGTQLSAARKAFWSGDTEAAEKIYLRLAAARPDNADIRGELGNLYYNAARMEDAARMYFEAGKILRKSGQTARLGAVVAALRGIAPDLAAQLAPATAPNN